MTNQSIRALYGSLVAMTLKLDDALSQKLNAERLLACCACSRTCRGARASVPDQDRRLLLCSRGQRRVSLLHKRGSYIGQQAHEAAQKQWDRCIAKYHDIKKDKRGGKRDKKEVVVPRRTKRVTDLLVMFHDLNAAERAAFFAAVPKRD
jgi:hypothetical protein